MIGVVFIVTTVDSSDVLYYYLLLLYRLDVPDITPGSRLGLQSCYKTAGQCNPV